VVLTLTGSSVSFAKYVDKDAVQTKWSEATCYHCFGNQKGREGDALVSPCRILLRGRVPCGNGVSGHAFQSPFASPPGVGLSSSIVNVLWGLFNLAVGYLLICRVGSFDLRKTRHVLVLGAGILTMSLMLANTFGPLHGGQ
jgi:hypothetical protein